MPRRVVNTARRSVGPSHRRKLTVRRPAKSVAERPATPPPVHDPAAPVFILNLPTLTKKLKTGFCNVFGVVSEFTAPRECAGTDFVMRFQVADDSTESGSKGLSVVLFAPDVSLFPKIEAVGDLIYIYRLRIILYGNEFQGQMVKGNDHTLFAVFGGKDGDSDAPRTHSPEALASPSKYSIEWVHEYRQKVPEILERTFLCDVQSNFVHTLSTLVLDQSVDLICRVEDSKLKGSICILWVWDGTLLSNELRGLESMSEPDRAFLYVQCHLQYLVNYPEKPEGRWFKFRGFFPRLVDGDITLRDGAHSCVLPLTDTHPVVKKEGKAQYPRITPSGTPLFHYTRYYQERYPQAEASTPPQTVTSTPHSNQPLTAVKTIISEEQPVPWKYHCQVRMESYEPENVTHFTHLVCTVCNQMQKEQLRNCTRCKGTSLEWIYFFVVDLVDHTGTIRVIVHDKEAKQLLSGLPAANLRENNASRDVIERRMQFLTNPDAVLDCCVMSYRTSASQEIRYQLFDTSLLQ